MDLSTTSTTPVVAPTRRASLKRVVATVVTAALAVGGLTVVAAAPASATVTDTVTDATLTWGLQSTAAGWGITTSGDVELVDPTNVPEVVANPSATPPVAGVPAYTKAPSFTLTDGTGSISPAGLGTLDFDASVTYSPFAAYGSIAYPATFTFSNFEFEATSTTRGALTADVTWVKQNTSKNEPTNVTLANFDISSASVTDGEFNLVTAAPDWANTVPAGKYSGAYTDSWPTSLVDVLLPLAGNSDFPVYFYRTSTSTGNNNKAPLPITVAATVARPSVSWITSSETNAGYVVSVTGDGFRQATLNGDMGIYVSIAPAGGRPGSDADDAALYLGTKWVSQGMPDGPRTATLTNGAFATSLTAPADQIDPDVEYSIYTWQAHTASNTTQETETPITINYEALERFVPTVSLSVADDSIDSSESTVVTASLSSDWEDGVTGTVEFFDGTTSLGTETIVAGEAAVTLSALSVGTHAITAKFSGDAHHPARTAAAKSVEVSKLDSTISLGLSGATATVGTAVVATATVNAGSTGSVEFFDGTTSLGTSTITSNTATKSFSDLTVGSHSITAKYLGDDAYAESTSAAKSLEVEKTTATVALTLTKAKEVFGKPVTATATVTGATGWVEFKVNGTKVKTVKLAAGKASYLLPKFSAGSHKVTVFYQGNETIKSATSAASTLVITKATTSKVTVSGKKFEKNSKPTVTVKVAKLNNGQYPAGKVSVYVGGKLVKTGNLYVSAKGTVKVTLPKQSKTIKVKAIFSGSNVTSKSSSTVTIKRK